jgi:hypothetical protein
MGFFRESVVSTYFRKFCRNKKNEKKKKKKKEEENVLSNVAHFNEIRLDFFFK